MFRVQQRPYRTVTEVEVLPPSESCRQDVNPPTVEIRADKGPGFLLEAVASHAMHPVPLQGERIVHLRLHFLLERSVARMKESLLVSLRSFPFPPVRRLRIEEWIDQFDRMNEKELKALALGFLFFRLLLPQEREEIAPKVRSFLPYLLEEGESADNFLHECEISLAEEQRIREYDAHARDALRGEREVMDESIAVLDISMERTCALIRESLEALQQRRHALLHQVRKEIAQVAEEADRAVAPMRGLSVDPAHVRRVQSLLNECETMLKKVS